MKHYLMRNLLFSFLVLFFSGCATTTSFIYDYPKVINPVVTDLKIAISTPKDDRVPNQEVDKMWSSNPVEEIGKVIQDEVRSTGLFKEVVLIKKGEDEHIVLEKSCIQMILQPSVQELAWEIPNLKEQERKALVISILTGGIGGLAYGSGSTDFYGKAKLRIVLQDKETRKILLDKEYFSRAEEKMARLKTDSAEERARIIGKAVKHAIDQLKVDLEQIAKAGVTDRLK